MDRTSRPELEQSSASPWLVLIVVVVESSLDPELEERLLETTDPCGKAIIPCRDMVEDLRDGDEITH